MRFVPLSSGGILCTVPVWRILMMYHDMRLVIHDSRRPKYLTTEIFLFFSKCNKHKYLEAKYLIKHWNIWESRWKWNICTNNLVFPITLVHKYKSLWCFYSLLLLWSVWCLLYHHYAHFTVMTMFQILYFLPLNWTLQYFKWLLACWKILLRNIIWILAHVTKVQY